MAALCCFSWIREVVDLLIADKKMDISLLPDNVIIEILVRLPAEDVLKCQKLFRQWQSLTSRPYFIQLHLKRATPSLFMSFLAGTEPREFICYEDDTEKKLKYLEIHSRALKSHSQYRPWLVGSCDGLLLFDEVRNQVKKIIVVNPITEELVSVDPPVKLGQACTIFFHPSTRDYIVLYWQYQMYHNHPGHSLCYRYFTYALRAKTWKEIMCFSYRPTANEITTVIVNGCMHWLNEQQFDYVANIPPCTDSIIVYDIENEEFKALPHPGPLCETRSRHEWMYLFEVKEEVIFVHICFKNPVFYVWVLEDYGKWGWVKRYQVDLSWMNMDIHYPSVLWLNMDIRYPSVLCVGNTRPQNLIRVLNIQNDELLIDWTSKGVFCYNLKLKKVWEITTTTGLDTKHEWKGRSIRYTESFVSPT